MDRFFLRCFDKTAGIDNNNVGLLWFRGNFIVSTRQKTKYDFRIHQILSTSEGYYTYLHATLLLDRIWTHSASSIALLPQARNSLLQEGNQIPVWNMV